MLERDDAKQLSITAKEFVNKEAPAQIVLSRCLIFGFNSVKAPPKR